MTTRTIDTTVLNTLSGKVDLEDRGSVLVDAERERGVEIERRRPGGEVGEVLVCEGLGGALSFHLGVLEAAVRVAQGYERVEAGVEVLLVVTHRCHLSAWSMCRDCSAR